MESKDSCHEHPTVNAVILGPHDVLMGRGAPNAYYVGNVSFRELVAEHKSAYGSAGRHEPKQAIARLIYHEISRRNGRFLQQCPVAATTGHKSWVVADLPAALEKIKQALRERDGGGVAYRPDTVPNASVELAKPPLRAAETDFVPPKAPPAPHSPRAAYPAGAPLAHPPALTANNVPWNPSSTALQPWNNASAGNRSVPSSTLELLVRQRNDEARKKEQITALLMNETRRQEQELVALLVSQETRRRANEQIVSLLQQDERHRHDSLVQARLVPPATAFVPPMAATVSGSLPPLDQLMRLSAPAASASASVMAPMPEAFAGTPLSQLYGSVPTRLDWHPLNLHASSAPVLQAARLEAERLASEAAWQDLRERQTRLLRERLQWGAQIPASAPTMPASQPEEASHTAHRTSMNTPHEDSKASSDHANALGEPYAKRSRGTY